MSQLLASDGRFICVEFPSAKDPKVGGPPFALPPSVYVEHLAHPGKEIPYEDTGHVKEGESGLESLGALSRIAHWQPERTHEIGKGQDWVSICKCTPKTFSFRCTFILVRCDIHSPAIHS